MSIVVVVTVFLAGVIIVVGSCWFSSVLNVVIKVITVPTLTIERIVAVMVVIVITMAIGVNFGIYVIGIIVAVCVLVLSVYVLLLVL